jgi:arginine decarboxylase-like protein
VNTEKPKTTKPTRAIILLEKNVSAFIMAHQEDLSMAELVGYFTLKADELRTNFRMQTEQNLEQAKKDQEALKNGSQSLDS